MRTSHAPKSHIEGDFAYLNNSARPEANHVRAFIESWVARYPVAHRSELEGRLRDEDDRHFTAACFELILFACMSSIGYELEIHPDLPNGSARKPDFLVRTPKEGSFYLEASLASELGPDEIGANKRKAVVLQAIDGLDSPDFLIGVRADGNPMSPPSSKKLKAVIGAWIKGLDYETVCRKVEYEGQDPPKMEWEHDGWWIQFDAIPKRIDRRGTSQRVIGVHSAGARWVNSWAPIRDAVRGKGTRYGELDLPMLIAVNLDSISLDRIDETQALFGEEAYVVSANNPDSEPVMRRNPNGAWWGPKGPQLTRVSGVWIFDSTNCWNVASRHPTIYINPWAAKPLPNSLSRLRNAAGVNGKLKWTEGLPFNELLGLVASWPEC